MSDWQAVIDIKQTATRILLNDIHIRIMPPDDKLSVTVKWSWVDNLGKTVRSGFTSYTEEQINQKLIDKGTSISAFRDLFMSIAAEEAVAP